MEFPEESSEEESEAGGGPEAEMYRRRRVAYERRQQEQRRRSQERRQQQQQQHERREQSRREAAAAAAANPPSRHQGTAAAAPPPVAVGQVDVLPVDAAVAVGDPPPPPPPGRQSVASRQAMGDFIDGNETMRSDLHANSFAALIQLVASYPGNWNTNFSSSGRRQFIMVNHSAIWNGPLSSFKEKATNGLCASISKAVKAAERVWNRDHSNGAGDSHEDIPRWVRLTMEYKDRASSEPAVNNQQENTRLRNAAIARSIVGAQATLGQPNPNPRNERSRNNMAGGGMNSRDIGSVETERIDPSEHGVERDDDNSTILPAHRTRRRNVTTNRADRNTATSRYHGLNGAQLSIADTVGRMGDAANAMIRTVSQPNPRTFGEIATDFTQINGMMRENNDPDAASFLGLLLQGLRSEAQQRTRDFSSSSDTPQDSGNAGSNTQNNNDDGGD